MTRLLHFLFAIALTLVFAGAAHATAQQADILLVDGKPERLFTNPLAPWLQVHRDTAPRMESMSSGNWRGYVATWEIEAGKLWLRKVDGARLTGKTKPHVSGHGDRQTVREIPEREAHDFLADLFPGRSTVVADWFTGTLMVPQGGMVDYVHMGYGSTYERYLVYWIRNGDVVRHLSLDAAQFTELRRERFARFKQTDEYKRELARLGNSEGAFDTEQFLFEFYSERYLSLEFEGKLAE